MKITIDVSDYGDIAVEPSRENPGCTRITIWDAVEATYAHLDLDEEELDEFLRAVKLVSEPKKVCR